MRRTTLGRPLIQFRTLRRFSQFATVMAMNYPFPRRLLLLLLIIPALLSTASSYAWAQSKINYKVIPNLEAMKDQVPTPDFTLPNLDSKKISLKDFRGKLVFLNFWATWCVPCREEMPAMEKLYQEFKEKNFLVLAVNVKDRKQDAVKLKKKTSQKKKKRGI
jgi:thiol-disulfide isomerase/thioredoxin